MAGLIGTGRAYIQEAEGLAKAATGLETRRNMENKQIEAAEKAKTGQMIGTGAAVGAMAAGAEAGGVTGPWGALIGAGVGYLASRFF